MLRAGWAVSIGTKSRSHRESWWEQIAREWNLQLFLWRSAGFPCCHDNSVDSSALFSNMYTHLWSWNWSFILPGVRLCHPLPNVMRKKQISGRKEGRIRPQGCSALGQGPVAWRNHRTPEYSCFKFWTTNDCAHLVKTPSQRTSLIGLKVGVFFVHVKQFFLVCLVFSV